MSTATGSNRQVALITVTVITFCLIAVGFALDYPERLDGQFFSDCATYYSLALSLANDFDLEYAREDIQRIYAEFSGGPSGIFLQRNSENNRLYHGKSFIYPLAIAPAVGFFKSNGVLVTHALILGILLLAMTAYWSRYWGHTTSLLVAVGYIVPTGVLIFYFWPAPEFFNFAIIFLAFFALFYKDFNPKRDEDKPTVWRAILQSYYSDFIALGFIGIAAFSKLSNGIYIIPILVYIASKRRWLNLITGITAFVLVVILLFGTQLISTGNWNYQGGERKSFHVEFPFARENDFESAQGTSMQTNVATWSFPFFPIDIANNITYFFFGRFGGLLPYYFPAVLILFLYIWRARDKWLWWIVAAGFVLFAGLYLLSLLLPAAQAMMPFIFPITLIILLVKSLFSHSAVRNTAMIAAMLAAFTYIILVPTNVIGGGGTVTNRYFMNIFPLFFFMIPRNLPKWGPVLCFGAGAVFMGHMLINPLYYSRFPARYADTSMLKILPVELTMLNDLPINTDPNRRRIPWFRVKDGKAARYADGPHEGKLIEEFQVYLLDYNTYEKEPNPNSWFPGPDGNLTRQLVTDQGTQQIWTVGGTTADLILRTVDPKEKLKVQLTNSSVQNRIMISLQGNSLVLDMKPREQKTLEFTLEPGYAYHYLSTSYLYPMRVSTSDGVTPRLQPGDENDWRHLGVMLEFWFD